ncbi:hypothetical protein SAMN04488543_1329 [Friedmanniella luteola]|uniref:Uncharacterized protein n=1 Tax=Friedmanniella luteola TaxID=546871 RepID=A0A1H1QJG6_9ACTN|nr:hypothetical protein [Friedmanniella luteola]SDS23049.1 hypothetical protein SAMN04488543_1329 [Friedmanniella luteola]
MTDVLLIALYVSAGIAAAWEARRKGYDDRLFLVVGLVLGPVALLLMLLLPPRALQVGTVVRPAAPIALEDGRRLRPSHVSVVREVAVLDGAVLCRITGPDAAPHWVAQEALTRVRGRSV